MCGDYVNLSTEEVSKVGTGQILEMSTLHTAAIRRLDTFRIALNSRSVVKYLSPRRIGYISSI